MSALDKAAEVAARNIDHWRDRAFAAERALEEERRGKAAALGLQNGTADVIQHLEAKIAELLASLDEVGKLYRTAEKEAASKEHFLALRTRQNTQSSELWAKAAEYALAGDLRPLRSRLSFWRDQSASGAQIVQSDTARPSSPTTGGEA